MSRVVFVDNTTVKRLTDTLARHKYRAVRVHRCITSLYAEENRKKITTGRKRERNNNFNASKPFRNSNNRCCSDARPFRNNLMLQRSLRSR